MARSNVIHRSVAHERKSAAPQHNGQTQEFGVTRENFIALDLKTSAAEIEALNQILADTMTLRDLYKKHHWQAAGPTFYMIHLLYDKHFEEQSALIDMVAERIQTLGGIAIAMAGDVAKATRIPHPPMGREETAAQIRRLIDAHDTVIKEARKVAKAADQRGDDATNDILVSNVLRTNELQVWFLAQHLQ